MNKMSDVSSGVLIQSLDDLPGGQIVAFSPHLEIQPVQSDDNTIT